MAKHKLAVLVLPLLIAATARADLFSVTIDTSSVNTQAGGIYFVFNPGSDSDPAVATISNFSPSGALDPTVPVTPCSGPPYPSCSDGDVTGSLLSPPLQIGNSLGLNDYLHLLTFGNQIAFDVNLSVTPSGGTSNSTFLFQLTGADGLTPILTGAPPDPDFPDFLGVIDIDPSGSMSARSLSSVATIQSETSAVPEPSTTMFLAGILGLLLFTCWRRTSLKRS